MGRSPLFTVNQDCLAVADRVVAEVEAAGMETRRTFDLAAVRSANPGFCCPVHAGSPCTCQFVILLVTPRSGDSLTLILEGRDDQAWVYFDTGQGVEDEQVNPALIRALYHAFFIKSGVESLKKRYTG